MNIEGLRGCDCVRFSEKVSNLGVILSLSVLLAILGVYFVVVWGSFEALGVDVSSDPKNLLVSFFIPFFASF